MSNKRNRQQVQDRRNDKKERRPKQEIQAQKFQQERKAKIIPLTAQNENQKLALQSFKEKQLCILSGSAGSGKSEMCVWWACKQWLEGNIENIIITRPDKGHGDTFPVPGGDAMKMLQFLFPLLMKMKKYLGLGILRNNLKLEDDEVLFAPASGIQIVSMAKLGGMSFDGNTIIIADEVQAATIAQVKALTTRAEEGCQIMITGDTTQTPLHKERNGLEYLEHKLTQHPHPLAKVVKFTPEDCCRKGISAHLTRIFEQDGTW
ncbi:putative phosphate starvation-inducible protein PhoH [Vibrio phage 249E41-1]|nr:putative phosphate starvation-inducible protein PhoH [Vibrio phage 249E41-1]CAH9014350.1 putative phosphate starvation-inducible protein PhoH [Vibrio phage 277E43-1]